MRILDAHEAGAITEAANLLLAGGLVALPTETVYGLGARALDPRALARIFAAKGRPPTHPLIAHVLDASDADKIAYDVPRALTDALWPGPLTLVLRRREHVPAELSGGLPTIAVRAPAHPVARALIAVLGEPIAAPSANRYQHVSPTTAAHVVRSLGEAVDLVLDGGPTTRGIESTVVSLVGPPRLLRPGPIDLATLRRWLPDLIVDTSSPDEHAARESPGMDARHYAPSKPTQLFRLVPSWVDGDGALLCGVALREDASRLGVAVIVLPAEPEAYAAGLYAALHDLDARSLRRIFVEEVPADEAWRAVRDRLSRAAGP